MSTLAITAAHFVAIPVRYGVGRWCNIPTNTMIAFNATDLGLNILCQSIVRYAATHYWKIPKRLTTPVNIALRVMYYFTAVYVASKLTEPMPLKDAALTLLASLVSVHVAMRFVK